MEGSEGKQWSKRLSWSTCREPYKTELDTLTSQWIEGTLSNGDLALEVLEMLTAVEEIVQSVGSPQINYDDVLANLKVLKDTLLAVNERPKADQTPELRRQGLEFMCRNELPPIEPQR